MNHVCAIVGMKAILIWGEGTGEPQSREHANMLYSPLQYNSPLILLIFQLLQAPFTKRVGERQ